MINNLVSGSNMAFERLEPCAEKFACTVLRGVSSSNTACLLDFAFVGRQYKLLVGNEDYYMDLLFYHLRLRSFIIIELKSGKFSPRDVGQLNFYLSAVDDQLKHPTDNPSIGLILCKDKGEQIKAEYALRDMTKPIGLAEYRLTESLPENIKTALPTIEELEAELAKDFSDDEDNQGK